MDPFTLDVRVTTPTTDGGVAPMPASTTTLVTKTPLCSKFSCHCTTVGACTIGCRR